MFTDLSQVDDSAGEAGFFPLTKGFPPAHKQFVPTREVQPPWFGSKSAVAGLTNDDSNLAAGAVGK